MSDEKIRLKLKITDKVEVEDEHLHLVTVRISKVTTMPPAADEHDTEPPKIAPKPEE